MTTSPALDWGFRCARLAGDPRAASIHSSLRGVSL